MSRLRRRRRCGGGKSPSAVSGGAQTIDGAGVCRNSHGEEPDKSEDSRGERAMYHGGDVRPACGGSPPTKGCPAPPRTQRRLSCGPTGLSGRRGEGHAVAVFCVEGPLRGRRSAQRGYGARPDIGHKISQVWPAGSTIGGGQHGRGRQLMTYSIAAPARPVGRRLAAIIGTASLAIVF